jgi:DNA-binding transcriptional LysR family regulator
VDIRDLLYFETIAGTGHLGRAAEQLGRTQPALTKCIRRLEDEIGAELFSRTGRGLQLTKVGEVLLARGSRLRFALSETLREVADFAKGAAGHVRIGAGATMAEHLLPDVTRALISRAPDVTVEILIGMSDVLRAALRDGDIDVAIGPTLKGEEQEFAVKVFGFDEVVVVAPRGHPLCGRKVSMEDLARYQWVLPASSVEMRRWLDQVFEANGLLGPRVQIETNSILLLPRLISETSLLSFTSTRNLHHGRVGVHLERLDIDVTTMRRYLGIIYRRHHYLSPAAMKLVTLLAEMGPSLLTPSPRPHAAPQQNSSTAAVTRPGPHKLR